jgi:predicted outer membrane protein
MKITSAPAILPALLSALLLAACQEGGRDNADTRSDTAVSTPQASSPQAAQTPADTALPLSAPPETPVTPVATDAQVLSRTSAMAGALTVKANMAQGRSRNQDVLTYANELMREYNTLLNKIESLAMGIRVQAQPAPGDSIDNEVVGLLGMLQATPDGKFDAVFVAHTIDWQRRMIDDLKYMESKAKNAALRNGLREISAEIRKHMESGVQVQKVLAAR